MEAQRNTGSTPRTFLGRLAGDARGNTLAMLAIALIPLSALAGSAIDTSRLYFVKVRLQQACDAGALAGRKFMTGTDYTATANTQAETFFNNNFKDGTYGSTGVRKNFSKTTNNQVAGIASATVPMTIMKMFGAEPAQLTVACEAKLEIPNLDVMFVLDTTGSMSNTNPTDTVSRIAALRTAVVNFYDTLEAAKTTSAQTRYGFVPYSTTVNVGLLLKREWMTDNWTYQSRVQADVTYKDGTKTEPDWITTTGQTTSTGNKTTIKRTGDPENCYAPASTKKSTSTNTGWVTQADGSQSITYTTTYNGSDFSASVSNGVCTITETNYDNYVQQRTDTRVKNPDAGKKTPTTTPTYWWNYQPRSYSLTALKGSAANGLMAGGSFTVTLSGGGGSPWSDTTISWGTGSGGACIEERDTVRQSDYATIPTAALDLDVDKEPTNGDAATQWRPYIPRLVYPRKYTSYSPDPSVDITGWPADVTATVHYQNDYVNMSSFANDSAACPSAARKLAVMVRGTVVSYMNGLKVGGRTYHDIGFLWGLRLLSKDGIFKTENQTAPNGSQIARNIIFMTDGDTETKFSDYDAYGLAALDRRRTDASRLPSGNGETDTIVENRLTALCRVARNRDTTVWVIAFGTTLTPLLSGCASPGAHAFQANNADELNKAFASIAANIAKLRVSK